MFQAIKATADSQGTSVPMVRSILKEKMKYGNVEGGPYQRNKKTTFERLTLEQRDQIRDKVIPD